MNWARISGTIVLVLEVRRLVMVLNCRKLCLPFILSCNFALFGAWFGWIILRRLHQCFRVSPPAIFQYRRTWLLGICVIGYQVSSFCLYRVQRMRYRVSPTAEFECFFNLFKRWATMLSTENSSGSFSFELFLVGSLLSSFSSSVNFLRFFFCCFLHGFATAFCCSAFSRFVG